LIYKRSYFVGAHIKYLAALAVLSVMSILLLTGFVGELEGAKSVGRGANEYGAATQGKVCGDRLCSETGGKIFMPWEVTSKETQDAQTEEETPSDINQGKVCGDRLCSETGGKILMPWEVTSKETQDAQTEKESTSDINQEVEETKSSLSSYITGIGGILLTKANVPVTIPLHQGYYNGKGVYHIITDSSDLIHADNITKTQGWEVNLAPLLANATKDALLKTYVFTNGLPGDGVYGFQGQVFTSTPAQADAYSALTSHVHVTWSPGALPRVLISEKEIFSAVQQRLVFLTPQNVVLNMPQIVWPEGQMLVKENKTLTNETPFVGGQILDIDLKKMTTTFIAHQGWDYEGKIIYSIVTDATPVGPALSLGVTNVAKNAALVSNAAAVDVFHFRNGIEGSGPLGFQAGIATGTLVNATYSPMSRIYFITWNSPDSASLIQSKSDIDDLENDDLISVDLAKPMGTDHIVNSPIVTDPFH